MPPSFPPPTPSAQCPQLRHLSRADKIQKLPLKPATGPSSSRSSDTFPAFPAPASAAAAIDQGRGAAGPHFRQAIRHEGMITSATAPCDSGGGGGVPMLCFAGVGEARGRCCPPRAS